MIVVTRKDFTGERVGDVRVQRLIASDVNRAKEIWLCVCLLCGAKCRKKGHSLIYQPARQCCDGCNDRKRKGQTERGPDYMPSLHQIWDVATKEIQSEWSREEENARRRVDWQRQDFEIQRAGFKRL